MLRSFLLITFRILWRNKVTSFANIFSMSVGITAFIFIILFVYHETRYDKFNRNYNRIYRLEGDDFATLPPSIGSHVMEWTTEVENIARLALGKERYLIYDPFQNPENRKEIIVNDVYADSTIFNVFSFQFIQGDQRTALTKPMAAVLTESTAKKLFGEEDPLMKTILNNDRQYTVTGIIKDINQSHIKIDMLSSMSSLDKIFPCYDLNKTASSWIWGGTYLLLRENVDKKRVEEKINSVLSKINDGILVDTKFKGFRLLPLKEIYFDREGQKFSYGLHGSWMLLQILIAVGIFILVLAAINYVNLTTARSVTRAKELAVRRVVGSSAIQLRVQLIFESIANSFISLAASLTAVQLLMPAFNQLTKVDVSIASLNDPIIWILIVGGTAFIGSISGVYPAFYLTRMKPINLIKRVGPSSRGTTYRGGLMTFQFALSVVLLVAIIVNSHQLDYVKNSSMGFNKNEIITIETAAEIPNDVALRETFRSMLLQIPGVEGISFTDGNPGDDIGPTKTLEINGIKSSARILRVDEYYLDVMGISISQGRGFLITSPADQVSLEIEGRTGSLIVNETMVNEFAIDDPIGKRIYIFENKFYEIIGVVKDFHFRSFHSRVEPLMMVCATQRPWIANVKVAQSNFQQTLKIIEARFEDVWDSRPFRYKFLDKSFNQQYENDEQLASVIKYATGLAIALACLGLFALSSFIVSNRTKELGIRKTLGASVQTIYWMLSWDFLKWIFLGVVIAWPIAWYLMRMWLNTFVYHINIGIDIFVMSAASVIGIALFTVTWQSIKVAKANPIDSLRYE